MRTVVLCILMIFWLNDSLTQSLTPQFMNYSTNEGLPSSEVHEIFQDKSGYLWFGTDNGLARLDGYSCKVFGARNGLENGVVVEIREDKEGMLWFGTLDGSVYRFEGDSIVPYRFNSTLDLFRNNFIDASLVHIDEDGSFYFMLVRDGFLKIDRNGEVKYLRGSTDYSLAIFRSDQLALATNTIGLTPGKLREYADFEIYDLAGNKLNSFREPGVNIQAHRAFLLGGGELLVCTKTTLYLFRHDDLVWKKEIDYMVHALLQSPDGGIWLGLSHNEGLRYYKSLTGIPGDEFFSYLMGETITSIFIDRDEGLWVASHNSGVFYSADPDVENLNLEYGLPWHNVTSVFPKSEKELFVGFATGQVVELNLNNGHFQEIEHLISEGNSGGIYDLFYDKETETLWLDSEYLQGNQLVSTLRRSDPNDNYQYQFLAKKYFFDEKNRFLWLLRGWGYYHIDLDELKLSSISTERLFSIYKDRANQTWMGNNKGLHQLIGSEQIHVSVNHPAFYHRIEDIDAIEGRYLVLGTKGYGVVIWKGDQIIEINADNGLASDMVEDVHVDENNTVWIATFGGMSKVILDQDDQPLVRTFTMDNGLPSNEIYQIKSHRDQIWVCTSGGLIKWMDPEFDSTSYNPSIQKLLVNGKEEDLAKQRFQYWENNVTFDFLTIDFQQYGQIDYRYRLLMDDPWNYSRNHSVNFARLAPGKYRFEVQSRNKDGVWSQSTTYDFELLKPWYFSFWFILLCTAILLTIGYFLFHWWFKRKQEKEDYRREIEELKKSALQAQMNPHFIFNCLNSIQGFVNTGQQETANNYLLNFSHLIRGCLNASLERKVTLEQDINFIRNYLDLEKMRFHPEFDYQIEVEENVNPGEVFLEPMLVLPFVENAVIHGLSRVDRKGEIKLEYSIKQDVLIVKIKDNGPGLSIKSQKKPNSHKSVGITITKNRLLLINRDGAAKFHMTEIVEDPNVLGTLVELEIILLSLGLKNNGN